MIYEYLLEPQFDRDEIIKINLFGTKPAITRVNKQIRAESLSIYYAENSFWLQMNVHSMYPGSTGYAHFCHYMERIAAAQAYRPGIQNPMRHIRELFAIFCFETDTKFRRVARFEMNRDIYSRCFKSTLSRSRTGWLRLTGGRLGEDEIDWADRTSVDALVKQRMEALPNNCDSQQERLIHVLWLLGVNIGFDSAALAIFDM